MNHHKDRFPEYELVGLAQVRFVHIFFIFFIFFLNKHFVQTFGNMEFRGVQYPAETMDRINELSFGIVTDFREGQKDKLKRTFVSGSDAANRKVNRL